MSTIAVQRVQKELQEIARNAETDAVKVTCAEEDMMHLFGEIEGPIETPYEKATYKLEIKIPNNYPFIPPQVKFVTRIWHPNISSATGLICLDILKDQWAAAMTIRTVLLSIQALLSAAEPDDPQDAVVANQYKNNNPMFLQTARHWANVYAQGPHREPDFDAKILQLSEMGFMEDDSRRALSAKDWNIDQSMEYLLK